MRAKIAAALALAVPALFSQQDSALNASMQAAEAACKTLEKLEAKTGPRAVRPAEALGAIYENMIAFWRRHNAADALRWSEEGKAAAVRLAAAAHAGNAGGAEAAFKALEATCRSCHDAHRLSLSNGQFSIKWSPERPRKRR